jgi:hypothetical protein
MICKVLCLAHKSQLCIDLPDIYRSASSSRIIELETSHSHTITPQLYHLSTHILSDLRILSG